MGAAFYLIKPPPIFDPKKRAFSRFLYAK